MLKKYRNVSVFFYKFVTHYYLLLNSILTVIHYAFCIYNLFITYIELFMCVANLYELFFQISQFFILVRQETSRRKPSVSKRLN